MAKVQINPTWFEVLGLAEDCPQDLIRPQYRKLARTLHPDAGGSTEAFQQLEQAYSTLNDEYQRAHYKRDLFLVRVAAGQSGWTSPPTEAPTDSGPSYQRQRPDWWWEPPKEPADDAAAGRTAGNAAPGWYTQEDGSAAYWTGMRWATDADSATARAAAAPADNVRRSAAERAAAAGVAWSWRTFIAAPGTAFLVWVVVLLVGMVGQWFGSNVLSPLQPGPQSFLLNGQMVYLWRPPVTDGGVLGMLLIPTALALLFAWLRAKRHPRWWVYLLLMMLWLPISAVDLTGIPLLPWTRAVVVLSWLAMAAVVVYQVRHPRHMPAANEVVPVDA